MMEAKHRLIAIRVPDDLPETEPLVIVQQATFDQTRELLDAIQVICDDPQTSYHIPGVLMDRLIALQAAMEATSCQPDK